MIVGGWDHTCSNKDLDKFTGGEKKNKCNELVKYGKCPFYKN